MRGDLFRTQSYSIKENGAHASTGWEGLNPPPRALKEIVALWQKPAKMQTTLETFLPLPADL